jgi:hypothetical protein
MQQCGPQPRDTSHNIIDIALRGRTLRGPYCGRCHHLQAAHPRHAVNDPVRGHASDMLARRLARHVLER